MHEAMQEKIDGLSHQLASAERYSEEIDYERSQLASVLKAILEECPYLGSGRTSFPRAAIELRRVESGRHRIIKPVAYLGDLTISGPAKPLFRTTEIQMVKFGMALALEPQTPPELVAHHVAEEVKKAVMEKWAHQSPLRKACDR